MRHKMHDLRTARISPVAVDITSIVTLRPITLLRLSNTTSDKSQANDSKRFVDEMHA